MNESTLYQQVRIGRLRLAQQGGSAWPGPYFQPPTDVLESEDAVTVVIEVAGLQEGDFEIAWSEKERVLEVSGRRQGPVTNANRLTYHRLEIRCGSFVTQVQLPWSLEGAEAATAIYEDGFLIVTLPKTKSRQVPVRSVTA